MKKTKQILALIGVVILIGLYVSTLVCALSSSENFMNMLMASIYATVIIPVLIWAYTFIYRLVRKDSDDEKEDSMN
ncbi:MAG: hypothetical protein J6K53_04700 [Roseburia sp.]|nr:hypothetical protein [Roseburia sp.]